MRSVIARLEHYLRDVLGETLECRDFQSIGQLPVYLRQLYEFHESWLINGEVLLVVNREDVNPPATMLLKHMRAAQKQSAGIMVYVSERMSERRRAEYIRRRIPFIVPGYQMYLPFAGVVLRERFIAAFRPPPKTLPPSAQAMLLYCLHHRSLDSGFTLTELAEKLGYTKMTIKRAFDSLVAKGLGQDGKKGKERILRFKSGKSELWERALPLLQSPVLHSVIVPEERFVRQWLESGETALARCSDLGAPRTPVYACWKKDSPDTETAWRPSERYAGEEEGVLLELWSYNPRLLSNNSIVDRLSLYISMRTHEDERIQMALEQMMRETAW